MTQFGSARQRLSPTIEIKDPATGKAIADVPMLLDTGADVTLLPRQFVNQLGVADDPAQIYELMGFDGTRSTAAAVHLDIIFVGLTFRGRFLIIDQPDGFWVETSLIT